MKNILYLLFFAFSFSFSQKYVALDTTDYKQRIALIDKIDIAHELLEKSIKKKYKKLIRKEIINSYEGLFYNLKKDIKKKELVFNAEFATYIDSLKNTILKNNTELISEDLNVYITKHNSPNALSLGNGYIFLNMGLFKYLENEAQLVSVLSHEMGHQILKHSENSILHSAKSETSVENKEEAKRIKKKKFNKQSEAFSALKEIIYTNHKKHRKQEIEADSIGFLLFKNTKYPPKSFLNAFSLLAKLDTLPSIELQKNTYKKFFDLPTQPFNQEWMKMEDFNNYNYNHYTNKINKDSIKSHPELIERIEHLKEIFSNDLKAKKTITNNSKFKKLQKIARYEDVANLAYIKKHGLSIYLTLYKLEANPKNEYYKKWLGFNFNELYEAKKKYQFNRYVDKIVPDTQEKNYQQFLSFLWNLRLSEIKIIADYYHK